MSGNSAQYQVHCVTARFPVVFDFEAFFEDPTDGSDSLQYARESVFGIFALEIHENSLCLHVPRLLQTPLVPEDPEMRGESYGGYQPFGCGTFVGRSRD